eukprot:2155133-Rhodomonas_salina.2
MLHVLNCHAELHQFALCSRQRYDRLPPDLPECRAGTNKQHVSASRSPGHQTVCIARVRESRDHAHTLVVVVVPTRREPKP